MRTQFEARSSVYRQRETCWGCCRALYEGESNPLCWQKVDRIHLPLETEEQQLVATFAHQCPTTHSEISLSAPLCLGCKLPKRWSECFFLFYFPPRRFGFTSLSFHASGRAQFLQIGQSASNVQTSQANFCS